jgi:hypothetical protein
MDQAAKDASGKPEAAVDVEEALRMVRMAKDEVEAANAAISRQNSPSQEVHIGDKQSAAVYILIVAAAMLMGMSLSDRSTISQQSTQINELQRKYDRMQDYLNAIYAQAPQLKPADYGKPEN